VGADHTEIIRYFEQLTGVEVAAEESRGVSGG
jgi:hypothetical protein